MFLRPRPDTARTVRKAPLTCFLFISLLFSTTVSSQPGPRILHTGLNCIVAGENVILEAIVEPLDELIKIKTYFRADISALFYYVEMTRVGDVYQAILPKPSTQISEVIYYLEAVDSAFNSARTTDFHPEVVDNQFSCSQANQAPPAYFKGSANITVGATGKGASFPPGFLTEGIVRTIDATGRVVASGGASTGTALAVAVAGGTAVGVGLLVTGNDNITTTSAVSSGGGTSSATTSTPATTMSPAASIAIACFDTNPDPPTIPVGGTVQFNASCTQPDRTEIATYAWSFSDGRGDREGRVVTRLFSSEGIFTADLTVTTLDGATDRIWRDIRVVKTQLPPTTTGAESADLEISSIGSPGTAMIGTNATYTINYQNNGPSSDPTVTIVTTFNALEFGASPALVSGGGCSGVTGSGSLTVTCFRGALAAGAARTRSITVQFPDDDEYLVNASISGGLTDPNPGNNSKTVSTPVLLRTGFGTAARMHTRFTSHLDVPPGDGSAVGRVTINSESADFTHSSGPTTHNIRGRSNDNVVEGIFIRNLAEGRWRFVFSRAPYFELGSFAIDEGQVVTQTPNEIVFRIGHDARRIRFRFRLKH